MSPSDQPALSIIVPLFNRAELIASCINSITALPQVTIEVIVVDDGSSDQSFYAANEAINARGAERWMRVIKQKNSGPGAARNTGAAAASGKWLVFLDSDDLWSPHCLSALWPALQMYDDAVMVFLQTQDFSSKVPARSEKEVKIHHKDSFLAAASSKLPLRFASCNVAVRKDIFEELGGFTKKVRCSEDTDLFLRADTAGAVLCLTGPWLVAHRVGEIDSLSGDANSVAEGFEFLRSSARSGNYGQQNLGLHEFLAEAAVYTMRMAFAEGYLRLAYGLLIREAYRIHKGGRSQWLWKLALTPVLNFLRPNSFPMRWRKRR